VFQRLKLKYNERLVNCVFNLNLRRYTEDPAGMAALRERYAREEEAAVSKQLEEDAAARATLDAAAWIRVGALEAELAYAKSNKVVEPGG